MAVTTTTSAAGDYELHEGTAQEVLDVLDGINFNKHIEFGVNQAGTGYFALVHA